MTVNGVRAQITAAMLTCNVRSTDAAAGLEGKGSQRHAVLSAQFWRIYE